MKPAGSRAAPGAAVGARDLRSADQTLVGCSQPCCHCAAPEAKYNYFMLKVMLHNGKSKPWRRRHDSCSVYQPDPGLQALLKPHPLCNIPEESSQECFTWQGHGVDLAALLECSCWSPALHVRARHAPHAVLLPLPQATASPEMQALQPLLCSAHFLYCQLIGPRRLLPPAPRFNFSGASLATRAQGL